MTAESLVVVAALISLVVAALLCLYIVFTKNAILWTSPEAAVFRSHYTELKAAIQSPEIVADELFAKGSIDFGVKEKVHLHTRTTSENCEILLHAIGQNITVDPNEFHVFISVLQKEPATKKFADRLFRYYHIHNAKCLGYQNHNIKSVERSRTYKGTYTCVAVALVLLLLSVVDSMWKLEFGLAPYSITAGVGALTLTIVFMKYWVTPRSLQDTRTDVYWEIERQQQFRQRPEKHEYSVNIFSLPQHIQVMVSHYQQLQTIFAIDKCECQTRELKKEEQFSPIVTVVDTVTQQTLDCVLLLHGENPPDVSSRTLFCYIAVQVTVVPYNDTRDSHPLYHMESKPCRYGKLPLSFHFHQPGTVCVIQLSIHSIADSEGIDYMYHTKDCTCIVQIISKKQHWCYSKVQHGVQTVKQPPPIRYTGPLASRRYHKLARLFKKLCLSPDKELIPHLSQSIMLKKNISLDIKIDALCWEAYVGILQPEQYKHSEELFRTAMEKASQLECQNGVLLQGMILKHLGYMQYIQGNDDEALKYISAAREKLANAAPSQITAQVLYMGLVVKWRTVLNTPQGIQSLNLSMGTLNKSIEGDYDLLLEHADFMEDYDEPDLFLFFTDKASFHLRTIMIDEDELPPKALWPSEDDLMKAEQCLNRISLDMLPDQMGPFAALYYRALCDLHFWNQKYPEAIAYAELGKQLCIKGKVTTGVPMFNRRLQLLENLMPNMPKEKEDEEIDEILKKFGGETI